MFIAMTVPAAATPCQAADLERRSTLASGPMPVLVFDLGGTRLKAGLAVGERIESLVAPSLERPDDAEAVVAQMVEVGRALAGDRSLQAVGAAVKGIVASAGGRVLVVNEPLRSLSGL